MKQQMLGFFFTTETKNISFKAIELSLNTAIWQPTTSAQCPSGNNVRPHHMK